MSTSRDGWDVYWSERWRRRGAWLEEALRDGGYAERNGRHHAELLKRHGCERVLDAACGLGVGIVALTAHGIVADGADASPSATTFANELIAERGLSRCIEHASWDSLAARFAGAPRYDAVLCDALVWAETEAEITAAAKAFRGLLRPGGCLLFHGAFPLLDEPTLELLLTDAAARAQPRLESWDGMVHRTTYRREGDALVEFHEFRDSENSPARSCEIRQLYRHTWRGLQCAFAAAGEWQLGAEVTGGEGDRRRHVIATPRD